MAATSGDDTTEDTVTEETTTEEATTESESERFSKCKYLNSVRASYTACCQYPMLVVWTWQFKECKENCVGIDTNGCCTLSCCLNKLGALTLLKDEKGRVDRVIVNWHGLVYSFMLSVGNDTKWGPVLKEVVSKCDDENGSTDSGYECDGLIPMSFYDIVKCSYRQNFLNCPNWNPSGRADCQYTYDFVEQCVDG